MTSDSTLEQCTLLTSARYGDETFPVIGDTDSRSESPLPAQQTELASVAPVPFSPVPEMTVQGTSQPAANPLRSKDEAKSKQPSQAREKLEETAFKQEDTKRDLETCSSKVAREEMSFKREDSEKTPDASKPNEAQGSGNFDSSKQGECKVTSSPEARVGASPAKPKKQENPAATKSKKTSYGLPPEKAVAADAKRSEMQREQELAKWEMPIPFADTSVPPLPLDVLPVKLRNMVETVSANMQVPPDLVFCDAMGMIATANQTMRYVEVEGRECFPEPLNLYLLCPMDPANLKSPVLKVCKTPLVDWEKDARESYSYQIDKNRRDYAIKEKTIDRLSKKASELDPSDLEGRDSILEEIAELDACNRRAKLHHKRLFADDVTPEKLAALMVESNEAMTIATAEGDLLKILAGQYCSKSETANLGIFLKGHTGEEFTVDRKNLQHSICLERPLITIAMTPQPSCLRDERAGETFRNRGLHGRFLYMFPSSLVGWRKKNPPELNKEYLQTYCDMLLSLMPPKDPTCEYARVGLRLSVDAYNAWADYKYDELEVSMQAGNELYEMKDWGGKAAGQVLRIAGNFHCVEHAHDRPEDYFISLATMQKAITLVRDYFVPHAQAAYGFMSLDPQLAKAQEILNWLSAQRLSSFSVRECLRSNRAFSTRAQLDPILQILTEQSYIRVKSTYGNAPKEYDVNPIFLA